jgi:hypothetical protein
MPLSRSCLAAMLSICLATGATAPASPAPAPVQPAPVATYADLADLADSAPLVLRAELRKLIRIEPAQARGVRPGWGRFYAEARTGALLAGDAVVAEKLRYLVDLPLDPRGKPPPLTKRQVLLFASAVANRPDELRLIAPDAQLLWDAASEARLRAILAELLSPGAPVRITGLREAIHVPGNLAGEGETQIFLATADQSAAAITVQHRTGLPATWGVSFSEVVEGGTPPARETLRWYRLACFLPPALPPGTNLSEGEPARQRAAADYRLVLEGLGPCQRLRR